MLAVCAAVFAAVLATLGAALWHSRARADAAAPTGERRVALAVAGAAGLTVVTLFGLLIASVATGRALQAIDQRDPLAIRITAYQWWWDVEYDHPTPALRVRTANELHLPAGRTVKLMLDSADVIHSFWAPTLAGKLDLVPGRRNTLWLRADTPGRYRQQCAEFCGTQHAHMAMDITVEPADQFDAWLAHQRRPATPLADTALAQEGRTLVEFGSCAMCHAIAGTQAGARTAPDLTHVASRPTIAAGTLPNTRESLRAWIENPQRVKPGSKMPPPPLTPAERDAVVAFLETLR
jgi:cytochrome c oxidase subunit 2